MTRAVARPAWQSFELQVLFTRAQIAQRVGEMGQAITRDYTGQSVILIGVLKGATIFLSDLARNIELETTFDFLGTSSYGNGANHSGEVRLSKDLDESVAGKNVILVEDILDTGLTLTYLKKLIVAHKPRSMRVAALLDKPSRRQVPIQGDYVGFKIPNEFVVGYGMDYCERYRNLPDIAILPREAYSE